MNRARLSPSLGLCLFLAAATAAGHDSSLPDSGFSGAWRITGGEPAGIDNAAPTEPLSTLIGATVAFNEHAIEAPPPLGCAGARYEIQRLPADMLFQGTLGDTAVARAQALDLSPTAAPTLMVQCDTGLFDYHLTQGSDAADPHLLIMLDRVIYTLERADEPTPTP